MDEVVDLELALDAGFSVEELRQTKTALNKFYKFLHRTIPLRVDT